MSGCLKSILGPFIGSLASLAWEANMNRDYTGFAVESAKRAIKWIRKYEEDIRLGSHLDYNRVLLKNRLKKLDLAIKNFNTAIAEVEVEIAYLNRGDF